MEFLILLLLILINGVLAMSELAVVSADETRLETRANNGDGGAQAALALHRDPDRFLATVQIGISLVGILAGAFGGATLGSQVADLLDNIPTLAPYADQLGFGSVVLVTTYLSLVIGELVPKRLAMQYSEAAAILIARPMQFLSRVVAPVVTILSFSTRLVLRILRVPPDPQETVSEIGRAHV